jgi:putative membrane protein
MVAAAVAACLATIYGLPAAQAQQTEKPGLGQRIENNLRQRVSGAQQGQPAQPAQNGQVNQRGQVRVGYRGQPNARMPSLTDWQIAEWISVDNQGEVALAEIAEQHASDKDVKQFAQQMVDEHTEFLQKLQRLTGVGGAKQAQDQANREQVQQPRQNQAPQGQFQQGLDLIALKHQLGDQCRQSASRELERKEGAEFDMCYMGMQIGMHMQMLDTLKVMSRHASQELDQLIEEGEKTTESHLEHAKRIMASLDGHRDSNARSARRETKDRSSDSSRENDSDK